jgi:hypothetical protein
MSQERNLQPQLLYSRQQAVKLLGAKSTMYLKELERIGKLKPIRPSGPRGQVRYRHADLMAVANEGL